MAADFGLICCKNCGHESHCGIKLMKDFRGLSGTGGIEGQIEVCKSCRCEKCSQSSWGQEKEMAETKCGLPRDREGYCYNEDCMCDPCECTEENVCDCCE